MKINDEMTFYIEVKNSISKLIDTYGKDLDAETINSVNHFLAHGEYEMAYEGMFIDLMLIGFNPDNIDIPQYIRIGILLGLNKKSTFDFYFWNKLNSYLNLS
ncbi:hypothetical protein [Pectobacterium wasabiae]|uniref:MafI family immunity protein n=1 Tax=Pectobacterium wasabiae TaxID=55208 RepID=A0AAW3EF11_9GAMM|nr:hypothetical protein [Pectobacterium wasabiae]AOR63386.1 hypothetical protein A7983_08955 [Pectobacterium wasabiae CFBP 3304]EJS96063.1 Hypothetical protein Y17_0695 [Pectobacterium wasabiae CFBP 3304]KFX04115.1 hypothetical protein JV38_16485 [Pectobacterium wasabiae]KGA27249.1 hypothetical protein KU73_16475 [Pectobacterium wasabiae]